MNATDRVLCQYAERDNAATPTRSMTSSQSSSRKRAKTGKGSDTSLRTKKSSAYDPVFEQHIIDHSVRLHGYDYDDEDGSVYSDNWEEINDRLAQPQPSILQSQIL